MFSDENYFIFVRHVTHCTSDLDTLRAIARVRSSAIFVEEQLVSLEARKTKVLDERLKFEFDLHISKALALQSSLEQLLLSIDQVITMKSVHNANEVCTNALNVLVQKLNSAETGIESLDLDTIKEQTSELLRCTIPLDT